MAERMTKSYADKIEELNHRIEKLQQNADAFYPKAGDMLFKVLEAGDLEDLKAKWNNLVPKDLKVDKIDCDVEMPKLDPTLVMKDKKKFAKMMEDYQKAADAQKDAAGKVLSNVLHVSVLGDLRNKLRELGILNDGLVEEVEDEEETVEETLEEVFAKEQEEMAKQESDKSTYDPFS